MRGLHLTVSFKKDLKRMLRQGRAGGRFECVVDQLRSGLILDRRHKDHRLRGPWSGWRECHIQPDWVLIYKVVNDEVVLGRTGTHSDVFDE